MALDTAFFPILKTYASQIGIPAPWLLTALYLESRFQPNAHRPGSSYYGLSQLSASALRTAGVVDPNDYLTWPASEQMKIIGPWYTKTVRDYMGHTPASPGSLYALNLLPGRVKERGDSQDTILTQTPEDFYEKNKGLDFDKNGTITIADLDLFMSRLTLEPGYLKELARLDLVAYPEAESVVRTVLLAGFALVVGIAGALFATRRRRV